MPDPKTAETTQLLRAWAGGDERALEALIPRVYRELRRLAGHFLRNERGGRSLEVTDLVHEVYLKLVNVDAVSWDDRAHFFAISARLMRRILLDRARRRQAVKRGGEVTIFNPGGVFELSSKRPRELIALDDALNALATMDSRKARIVELRFFAGLGVEETARVIGVSPETVNRDWKLARAWLSGEMSR
jgi:RNA polymerase sigma factor (TIGR02999 family)